ncbi:unnamed protein product [Protopolystoma xenopodis]|uniref:60S ribosomal protein L13 n=1 Tax=Protopolystoma xenopodis TaxID=117903 RepID=A0A3S5B9Q2_9PLAT|nr:unnamed protein product [Protopolystoma xenopodis]
MNKMPRGNDIIHNNHFHKKWRSQVKTWFNQPARKHRRLVSRRLKAKRISPRPVAGPLRPVVSCPTLRYNMKVRSGRGFSLQELRAAGLNIKYARTIGISVDHRRRNRSVEGLQRNVARLRAYKSKVVVLPVKAKPEKIAELTQRNGRIFAAVQRRHLEKSHVPTEEEKGFHAFHAIRQHRANARHYGKRLLKRQEAAAD